MTQGMDAKHDISKSYIL